MSLPDREEIAEIVSAGVRLHTPRGEYYALEIADALLARLRPAWDGMTQEYERNLVSLADACGTLRADLEATMVIRDGLVQELSDANADLRACAEALETLLPAMDTILRWIESHKSDLKELTDADFKMFRESVNDAHAALARPGCRDALK